MRLSVRKGLRGAAVTFLACAMWLVATPVHAEETFDSFCNEWMGKLAVREQQNLQKMQFAPENGRVVGAYKGYDKVPVRCQTRAKAGTPGVGTLVYHEVHYKKVGPTVEGAKTSAPQIVEKVEVMEIFRYDGKKWKY
jgi:hypothetical protein